MTILANATVLIAEAHPSVASGLHAMIGHWGGVGRIVRTSTELHASLHDTLPDMLPDILLVNIDMVGGREGLRALALRHPIRIVAMSAQPLPAGSVRWGSVMCLEMPFSIDDLQTALTSACGEGVPRLNAPALKGCRDQGRIAS
ncbi:response regulator transcription factor [Azospirillum rugosum]|uniref:DNA-binding NarL/FixJ family response regulator n=1 Tax=Azospirillum rugosum TaxID=416170 RepID=A0ABS4SPP1_9PROT|nr:response regulator transcription factor [Azospirillum rugosum]MBP2293365.1 DNA-binding NarL/FixJ family response regulator [Azospirillum rugosum]